MSTLRHVLAHGTRANRFLRGGLAGLAFVVFVYSDIVHLLGYAVGVDLEIPLRAAERWLNGLPPYDPAAFAAAGGVESPFLYPPYVLPMAAALTAVPRTIAIAGWLALCLACLVLTLRRLRMSRIASALVLVWPPTVEALVGGNPQLLALACFAMALWVPAPHGIGERPFSRRFSSRAGSQLFAAVAGATSAAIKLAHPHSWLYVLRRRPREALIGAVVVGAVIGLTLPITGLGLWSDWLDQLRLAAEPDWPLGGIAIARLVSVIAGLAVFIFSIVAVMTVVPTQRAGAWIGLLAVIGAPSLHNFGLLLLLPSLVLLRVEIALVAAIFIATTSYEGSWAGILVVAAAMIASQLGRHVLEFEDAARGGPAEIVETGEAARSV